MRHPFDLIMLGCGNMGAALVGGYLSRNAEARVLAIDLHVERAAALLKDFGAATIVPSLSAAPDVTPQATIVALKPQAIAEALPALAAHPAGAGRVISVAAGTSTGSLRRGLPEARLIRAMPNTPALVGKGVTVLFAAPEATPADRAFCEQLFGAVGTVYWIAEEALMDAVTAVSGSGPAYVFAVVEAFMAAAREIGLSEDLSAALVADTVSGAATMICETGRPVAELKSAVRSPAGTTDAALRVFEDDDELTRLFARAVAAANQRARELGSA
jgi:pyrroline-5-carboxylate reductase